MKIFKVILKISSVLIILGILLIILAAYTSINKPRLPAYKEKDGKIFYTMSQLAGPYTGNSEPYQEREIEGVDAETFKILHSEFTLHSGIIDVISVDKNYVYIQGIASRPVEKLVGADPKTIKQIKGIVWLQDEKNVYLYGEKVDGADPKSFVEIRHPLYKDKNNVYLQNKVFLDADVKTFSPIMGSYYKDVDNVYSCSNPPPTCKVVVGASPKKFDVQVWSQDSKNGLNSDFAFDDLHVFYGGTIIEGADPKTFHKIGVGSGEYYKDENHTYKYSPETRAKIILER